MIERLYIQNFRCLENITLDFTDRPSALILGKSGVGKTTIREALAIFQGICRGSSRVGSLIAPSDFPLHQVGRPMRFEIDVALVGKRLKYVIGFDWPEKFREARILEERLSLDGQDVFTRQLAQIQLPGGPSFGLDWHVFALPVINERPPERTIQDLKGSVENPS